MPTPQKIIDAAASRVHLQFLKGRGWRKQGRSWMMMVPAGQGATPMSGWPRALNFQLSQWNSAEEASFTVNLGISIPEIRAALGSQALEGWVKEYDCELRERLGTLIHGKDHWWKVAAGDDPERLAGELTAALESHALPWFESFTSYLDVARADRSSRGYGIVAVMALQMGGEPEATARALVELLKVCNPLTQARLRQIAARCGIALPPGEA